MLDWQVALILLLIVASPLLVIVLVVGVVLWFDIRHLRKRLGRASAGCPRCGYDLRVQIRSGAAECPECGKEIAPHARGWERPRTHLDRR